MLGDGADRITVAPEDGAPADGPAASSLLIEEIVREGARRMLTAALEAEVHTYVAELADQRGDRGRRWWSVAATHGRGR
jgi:hypothetical protein